MSHSNLEISLGHSNLEISLSHSNITISLCLPSTQLKKMFHFIVRLTTHLDSAVAKNELRGKISYGIMKVSHNNMSDI